MNPPRRTPRGRRRPSTVPTRSIGRQRELAARTHLSNARNFVNWGLAPVENPLPLTAKLLSRVCDVRLPLMWDEANFADMVDVLCESLDAAVGYQNFE